MIKFVDLKKITESFQPELGNAVERVIASGYFVRGQEVKQFEEAYAAFIGTSSCVGVGNGFDALRLIFKAYILSGAIQKGDEVIVPANTYIASMLAVTESGLEPVFVEPDPLTFNIDPANIERAITHRTKAILLVHLYGRNAFFPEIKEIAARYRLKVVEDNAQAAGCYGGAVRTGALGDAAAHSFFPTKNLGALGDGGAVTTDDEELAETIRTLGHYGSHRKGVNDVAGVNSRLDEVQAAVLSLKLRRLDDDNSRRRGIAQYYLDHIRNPHIVLPTTEGLGSGEHVWHVFIIRCAQRDALRSYLLEQGIETLIHYPVPPHKQGAYRARNDQSFPITEAIHSTVLSLPLTPVMEHGEIARIAKVVNGFSG